MADAPTSDSGADSQAAVESAPGASAEPAVGSAADPTTEESPEPAADPSVGAPEDLKSSFRDALARKAGRNSHVESHLDGRHLGSGNNDTHKRQFRRKSG